MPDIDKVIRNIEYCTDGNCSVYCNYLPEPNCTIKLMEDALVLLEIQQARIKELEAAQTPRVMTPEEVEAVPEGGVVWEEIRTTKVCEARIRHGNSFVDCADCLSLDEVTDSDDYLRNYRCWTHCPTNKQQEAVKWE